VRIVREIAKHIRIYGMLVRMNVMSQMEYRTNFVTGIMMELGYLVVKILYILVTYRAGRSIAGFTPDQILVFIGTFVLVTGFYAGVFMMNFFQLSPMVRDGSFDTLMTKPVSLQFMATFRRSDIGIFTIDAGAGLILTAIGMVRLGGSIDVLRIAGYALFVASGSAVGYALYLIPQSFVFRVINSTAIAEFTDSFWDFNNVPMVVYGRIGQAIGVYLIPMFVVTSFPALFALGKLDTVSTIWGIAAPFLFLGIARLFWKSGIRNYTSASG
jgi:ABC-2 type transport system permease protein